MHHIVSGTDDALNFTILQRGVGTRHLQEHVVGEEGLGARVVKLTPLSHWMVLMVEPNCVDT
jgi:hypothetical protein